LFPKGLRIMEGSGLISGIADRDISKMTDAALLVEYMDTLDADPNEEDLGQDFEVIQQKITAIEEEMSRRSSPCSAK